MASLERVVDILNGDNLPEVGKYVLSAVAAGDLLKSAPEGSKHKLKVKISSLLKSSGAERAFGAQLARAAISVDWSVIKSHGASWAAILTRVLDLPDSVGWTPAIQFLSTLTTLIHGKPELVREVTNAKISDFIKRLVVMLDKAPGPALDAFSVLLQLYPGACRAYATKISDRSLQLLSSRYWQSACKVLAVLPWAEKNAGPAWREAVADTISNLASLSNGEAKGKFFNSAALKPVAEEKLWYLLALLIGGAKPVAVKIPAAKLASLIDRVLRSLDPDSLQCVYSFFVDPKVYTCLESFYVREFDMLLHHFAEAVQLNRTMALKYAKCSSLLVGSAWVPTKYNVTVSRLIKHVLAAVSNTTAVGIDGLSDYVSHPESFQSPPPSDLIDGVNELFQAVILNVTGLNHSSRVEIDSYFISTGRKGLNAAALYPGKFSVLPIALNIGVEGLESLIHPRFPPLPGQSATIENEEAEEEIPLAKMVIKPIEIASKEISLPRIDEKMPEFIPEPRQRPVQSPMHTLGHVAASHEAPGHDQTLDEIESPHFEPAVEPEMPVPEPTKPQPEPMKAPTPKRNEPLPDSRPEKRARVDGTPTKAQDYAPDDDDDNDEFVMPILQMDSD